MPTEKFKSRSRWIALALLVLGYALMFWPRATRAPSVTASAAEPAPANAELTPTPPAVYAAAAPAGEGGEAVPSVGRVDKRPLIAKVELDKTVACPGEDVQASFTKLADVANPVQYTVPSQNYGNPVIVRYDEPGEQTVHVVANDGVGGLDVKSATLRILEPTAIECASRPMVWVSADLSSADADTAAIDVRSNLGDGVRYSFEFGDGQTLDTSAAHITHSYAMRLQRDPTSTYVIHVRATDVRGHVAEGRGSIAFRNTHWLSSVVGSPMMPASFDRFTAHVGTHYATQVTFRNIEERPVQFTKASIMLDTCRDEELVTTEVPIETIVGGSLRLEPGQELSTELSLPEERVAGACRAVVLLEGDTIPPRAGTPIGPNMPRNFDTTRAQLALEIAPPPTEGALPLAAPKPIIDPEMTDALERAQALVGPDRPLTPELLAELRRDGKL
jgi:hypothetical protein